MCLRRDAIALVRYDSPRSHSLGRFLRRTNCSRSNYFYNSDRGVVINLRSVTSTRGVFEKLLSPLRFEVYQSLGTLTASDCPLREARSVLKILTHRHTRFPKVCFSRNRGRRLILEPFVRRVTAVTFERQRCGYEKRLGGSRGGCPALGIFIGDVILVFRYAEVVARPIRSVE